MDKLSRPFQIFAKPAGAACNLACQYCYYLKKEELYPDSRAPRMSEAVLTSYIRQWIDLAPGREIQFSWHGGEATTLGLDYFRRIVAIEKEHCPVGKVIANNLQTNGVLVDEEWCRFLSAEGFSVGLSLDGPEAMHDGYRVNKAGAPTHRQVMQAYRLLRRHKVPVDLLCVVHAHNVDHPLEVYRFFKQMGAEYISFIPLVEQQPGAPGSVTGRTARPEVFGRFLCAVFDEWVRNDMGRVMVQSFEEAVRPSYGMNHSLCVFRPTCGDVPVVEHNGDYYQCDHFVDPAHRLGNLLETPLQALLESAEQAAFGRAKQSTLPRQCRECEVLALCNGGCPKDRIATTPAGESGWNFLCAGYRLFFNHCRPYTQRMAELLWAGQPPESLMDVLRAERAKAHPKAGRNDPCPCGSGQKFKKCCLTS